MRDKWHRNRHGGRAATHRRRVSLSSPPPPRFVTRPRTIFARTQDGAGDRELPEFFRDKNTHKPPASRLLAMQPQAQNQVWAQEYLCTYVNV